jgi:hypothetical protein
MKTNFVALALMVLILAGPVMAAPKATPDQQAKIECVCTCGRSGSDNETKRWNWSGSRADCQAYTGSQCQFEKNGATVFSALYGCDTSVTKPNPGTDATTKPLKDLERSPN